jgi:imidazolonepropionase-like amidohydrolase
MLRHILILSSLAFSAASAQPIVIRAGTVLDGKGGVLRNRDIIVEEGRITRVVPSNGQPTHDLSKYTLTPGWIDTHIHLGGAFMDDAGSGRATRGGTETARGANPEGRGKGRGRGRGRGAPDPEQAARSALYAAGNAYITLMAGFTTVQSVGAAIDGKVRDLVRAGVLPGPRILTSLRVVRESTGGPEQIREEIRRLKADGADVVKVYSTQSIRTGGGPSMTDEQIQAACSEAKAVGLRTVVHAQAASGAKAAAQAGCTQVEHGSLIDDEALKLIAAKGLFFDPTFTVFYRYYATRSRFSYAPEGAAWMDKGAALEAEATRKAIQH